MSFSEIFHLGETTVRAATLPGTLGAALSLPPAEIRSYLSERKREKWGNLENLFIYAMVRAIRPDTAVETGVETGGGSTLSTLRALRVNGKGRLISIDLPVVDPQGTLNSDGRLDGAHVESAEATGREIPDYLRDRWNLVLGNAKAELPKVLEGVGSIDLFFHDSDHSYAHQMWEYRTAWPYLRRGGVLASDDVEWTPAFVEFARSVGVRPGIFKLAHRTRGAIRKP